MLVLPLLTFSFSLQTQRADAQLGNTTSGAARGGIGEGDNNVVGGQSGTAFSGNVNQGTQSVSVSNGFFKGAPVVITGENVYVAWWTNNTSNENEEVMFRASTDSGVTFADKINLSNTTDAESQDVEIAAEGENVIVTWWERNATSDTPVMRVSANGGDTFGPTLRLGANGTIGVEEEEEQEGGEAVEAVEEAVGGAGVAE
jgi:hypothetical protein